MTEASTPIRTRRDPNGAVIVGAGRQPVLCTKLINTHETLSVYGGLHYIKGNSAPYFSIYAHVRDNTIRSGDPITRSGCLHDEILEHFPSLASLVALHLSYINGQPMYAEANGWYYLCGAIEGGLWERYHSGNRERNFPCAPPEGKTWPDTEYRYPTLEEALGFFAEHIRAPIEEARAIRQEVVAVYSAEYFAQGGDSFAAAPGHTAQEKARSLARNRWADFCAGMAERWAREARAAIIAHDLVIYGDGGLRSPELASV